MRGPARPDHAPSRPAGIPRRPDSPLNDAAFDRGKTIILYCASGGRTALAGKTLKDMGYRDVRNLNWVEAGGVVE
ncbi:MAG: rhodanese-like domain-containing protein [Roseomonas sp.]|jgi:rhodanese-related sulfurtransferase|nr:rhodanese-like domain-containing protein [Roseomonas sp.]